MKNMLRTTLCLFALLAAAPAAPAAGTAGMYLRVVYPRDGLVQLDTAVRRFVPVSGKGPEVWLVGVTHIGDPAYYDALQKQLDERTVVFYEGVGRPEFLDDDSGGATNRPSRTRSAAEFWLGASVGFRTDKNRWPRDFDEAAAWMKDRRMREAAWTTRARKDAWGRPFRWRIKDDRLEVISLGADGKKGGRGADRDIGLGLGPEAVRQQADLSGLQTGMAESLGLVFQMGHIKYDREHYENVDMSLEELKRTLRRLVKSGKGGGEVQEMMQMLEGGSLAATVAQGVFKMVGATERSRAMMKLVMIGILGRFDEIVDRGVDSETASLMKVLIGDRNRVVIERLRKELPRRGPEVSIGLIYGAGHMPDLEAQLRQEFNYRPAATRWHTAFGVDTKEAGLSENRVLWLQTLVEMQLDQMRKEAEAARR